MVMLPRKLLALLALGSSAWSNVAFAQSSAMDLKLFYPPQNTSLSDQRIYKITFSCKALANLSNGQAANIFIRQDATSSHFIVINDKLAGTDASGNATFPTSGVAFLPVFAITKGVVKIDNRTGCLSTPYLTGGPDL